MSPEKIAVELRVRQIQKRRESIDFATIQLAGRPVEKPYENRIELTHSAPTPPAQSRKRDWISMSQLQSSGGHQKRRSTISFLISAIALPGFKLFGQACVQFRIV